MDTRAYPDIGDFYSDVARVYREEISDLAAAGCRFIQIDEVDLALSFATRRCAIRRAISARTRTMPRTYARVLNETVAQVPSDMVVSMHLCRGNFAGAWVAEGGYDPIAELLFNGINIDVYYLEYDSARAGGFEPLRFLPKGKIAVLGIMTTKDRRLEGKDGVQAPHRRGRQMCAARAVGAQPAMRLLEWHRRQHHDDRGGGRQAAAPG